VGDDRGDGGNPRQPDKASKVLAIATRQRGFSLFKIGCFMSSGFVAQVRLESVAIEQAEEFKPSFGKRGPRSLKTRHLSRMPTPLTLAPQDDDAVRSMRREELHSSA
jgi:hypothetical protein